MLQLRRYLRVFDSNVRPLVRIFSDDYAGCYSRWDASLGWNALDAELFLDRQTSNGARCLETRLIQHEMLHVIDYYHMHTRIDRDSYVTVNNGIITCPSEYSICASNVCDPIGSCT